MSDNKYQTSMFSSLSLSYDCPISCLSCGLQSVIIFLLTDIIIILANFWFNIWTVIITVPDMKVGHWLGPEGNGVIPGERGKGELGPPRGREDKQSTPNKEGGNMEKEEEGRAGRA
jgi:hypothetical protein